MGDLYDVDVLEWSVHQARLLRQHAAGEASNEAPDWANIIEEIESVGNEQLHAVESNLVQALTHDLKCEAWPLLPYVPHWRAEARALRRNARRRFVSSMRGKIDLAAIYTLAGMPDSIDGQPPLPVPEACPVTLDELLSNEG